MSGLMPNIASVTDLQRNSRKLLFLAKRTKEPIVILKKNKPTAVLMDYDFFKEHQEIKKQAEMVDFEQAVVIAEEEKRKKKLKKLRSLKDLMNEKTD